MYVSGIPYFRCGQVLLDYNHNEATTATNNFSEFKIMQNTVKKVLFVAGISALALTDMATAVTYMGTLDTLFIGDAIVSNIA